jgi:hypothetical protein
MQSCLLLPSFCHVSPCPPSNHLLPTSDVPIVDMLVWLVMDGMDEIISAMVWLQFVQ